MPKTITDFYLILRGEAKLKLKSLLRFIAKWVWRKPLDRTASINLLQDFVVSTKQHDPIFLQKLASANGVTPKKFSTDHNIVFDKDYVWKIEISDNNQSIK